ncbi:UNKNOWN [Stylonychia lemnae]|uniref:Uncharacterized protein n=1 Tax=Stylonychia lemnae TaxID=5949 RepID=A0A078APV6_STYLE|nr:UNKNOWN [Stylonychia lemnae]|eukprot:CDW84199.1 UNKNOWN [Stylonychia lemnae]
MSTILQANQESQTYKYMAQVKQIYNAVTGIETENIVCASLSSQKTLLRGRQKQAKKRQ